MLKKLMIWRRKGKLLSAIMTNFDMETSARDFPGSHSPLALTCGAVDTWCTFLAQNSAINEHGAHEDISSDQCGSDASFNMHGGV